ncbi:hypothetical protein [Mucilaginibacter sp.]|uniref:hypothetical protein n=1 Tax=Mucilaginibacter sp. TaxID=1882438 RepID=UPI00262F9277|nr:hypothetical protein [Mucilaginibacter sp.]MDB5128682.1 rane protein [Mucilaginibacter sp.]
MAKISCFLSLLFTGLTLGPGMAHLLEMPHKISLSIQGYKIVQAIYRGWALLGVLQAGTIIFTLDTGILRMQARYPVFYDPLYISVFSINFSHFFIFTYPINVATNNWIVLPGNWMQLRQQWEYSHASAALLELLAFVLLILVVLNKGLLLSKAGFQRNHVS